MYLIYFFHVSRQYSCRCIKIEFIVRLSIKMNNNQNQYIFVCGTHYGATSANYSKIANMTVNTMSMTTHCGSSLTKCGYCALPPTYILDIWNRTMGRSTNTFKNACSMIEWKEDNKDCVCVETCGYCSNNHKHEIKYMCDDKIYKITAVTITCSGQVLKCVNCDNDATSINLAIPCTSKQSDYTIENILRSAGDMYKNGTTVVPINSYCNYKTIIENQKKLYGLINVLLSGYNISQNQKKTLKLLLRTKEQDEKEELSDIMNLIKNEMKRLFNESKYDKLGQLTEIIKMKNVHKMKRKLNVNFGYLFMTEGQQPSKKTN